MLPRLSGRYGWRGVWLLVVGLTWIAFGIGQVLTPVVPHVWILHEHLPNLTLALGWWITGAVAVAVGLRSNPRDTGTDALGHVALYLMPAMRVVSYLLASAAAALGWLGDRAGFDGPDVGDPNAWFSALLWCLVSAMLAVGAAWPNPQLPLPAPPVELRGEEV